MTIREQLEAPFKTKDLQWRIGSKNYDGTKAIALCYLDARAVVDRLNDVFGIDGWEDHYMPVDLGIFTRSKWNKDTKTKEDKPEKVAGFMCTITAHVGDRITSRQDGSECTDNEAFKGGISGAFKRAAAKFGIGKYLYDLPNIWYPIDKYNNFMEQPVVPDEFLVKEEVGKPQQARWPQSREAAPAKAAPAPQPSGSSSTDMVFSVGKYKGKTFSDIYAQDKQYMEWAANNNKYGVTQEILLSLG